MMNNRIVSSLCDLRVTFLPVLAIVLLFVGPGFIPSAHAQDPTPLARVEALGLKTAQVGRVTAYFASADRKRALELATLTEDAAAYFERELDISFEIGVAVLAPEHWFAEPHFVPYAIPWVSMSERLLFAPSSLSEGLLVYGPTPLHDRRRIDFIHLHEYSHLADEAFFGTVVDEVPWFREFLANYFAYAYIRAAAPEWAEAGKSMWRGVVEGYTPGVLSLEWEFMYDLPTEQMVRTYGWYQNLLNLRAAEVYDAHGMDFLRKLKDQLAWEEVEEWTTESLLRALEEIAPGFKAWSEDLLNIDYLSPDDH